MRLSNLTSKQTEMSDFALETSQLPRSGNGLPERDSAVPTMRFYCNSDQWTFG